jgi:hypothetical protein
MTNGQRPPVPEKKGLSPWIWLGIGCVGILVISGVAFSVAGYFLYGKAKEVAREMEDDPVAMTARLIAAANPEIDLVEADKENRVVTFRNTQTGEEFVLNYEDVEEGRFSFTSGDETTSMDFRTEGESGGVTITSGDGQTTYGAGASEQPDWVPVYPGIEPQGTYASETPDLKAGAYTFETGDSLDYVLDFYASALEAGGFTIQNRTTTPGGALVVATTTGEARSVTITASVDNGAVSGLVNFTEKKQ